MSFELTRDGTGIATITINRPERRNAIRHHDWSVLDCHLAEIREDVSIKVVVVTGAGDFFCAGGDLTDFPLQELRDMYPMVLRSNRVMTAFAQLPVPTIAKVRGGAYGAGLSLAMACDLVVAARDSVFVAAFIRRGLGPDLGSSFFLTRAVGRRLAKELLYLGRDLPAEEARAMGLVNVVAEPSELDRATHEIASALVTAPRLALVLTKKLVDSAETADLAHALDHEALSLTVNALAGDAAEQIAKFLRERPNP